MTPYPMVVRRGFQVIQSMFDPPLGVLRLTSIVEGADLRRSNDATKNYRGTLWSVPCALPPSNPRCGS